MPGFLADTSIWIAAAFERHLAHDNCVRVLSGATSTMPVWFCLAAQLSVARLITTRAVQQAYGTGSLTNVDAIQVIDAFLALHHVQQLTEPIDVGYR